MKKGLPVARCAVIESMTGARIVRDTLEQEGWSVEIADAQKGEGAGAACLVEIARRLAHAIAPESGARPRGGFGSTLLPSRKSGRVGEPIRNRCSAP